MSIICIEQTNTRLRTNDCALSSRWIFRHAPLFSYQNAGIHKGIRAQQEELTATRAPSLVLRRVSEIPIPFDGLNEGLTNFKG
jgi:hypothetical protein